MILAANRLRLIAVLILSGLASNSLADPSAIQQDPTVAPVPLMPEFHRRLDDGEYTKRAAALAKPLVPGAAFAGALIVNVDDGSPGAALGLQPDEVIYELDGRPVLSDISFDRNRDIAAAQTMRVWSPKTSASRAVQIGAGKIGINTSDFWSIENEYLHSLGKDRANDDLLTAARAAATDGDLAETALARANLHTPMANLIAAAAAYYELRLDDCLSYASAAQADLPEADRGFAQLLAYRAAVATFRWEVAQKIGLNDSVCNKYELPNAGRLPAAMTIFRSSSPESMSSPADAFKTLTWKDQTDDLEGIGSNPDEKSASQDAVEQLRSSKRIQFSVPADYYNTYYITPRGANIDLSMRVHFHASSDDGGTYGHHFKTWLRTGSIPGEDIYLAIFDDGAAQLEGRDIPTVRLNVGQFCGGDRPFNLRWTVVGRRYEIELGDRRAFYGAIPLDESRRDFCLAINAVGATGQVDHLSWKTAGARGEQQK